MNKTRLLGLAMIAVFPSFIKRALYRTLFGYKIGKNVRIGLSIIDANSCTIGDNVSIGHLNMLVGIDNLSIGEHARIGHLNIIRGGTEVRLGRYIEILRLNEINSIPDPIAINVPDPRFLLGDGSIVTTSHKIDFTDRVEFGKKVVLGGRNSSLWTHNRQSTVGITIGDCAYIGSEIRIAPGGSIPANSVVGIGSVIAGKLEGEYCLFAGVPAKKIKELDEDGKLLTTYKTRPDLPDDI
jgi:acetyltransferase-like isoleucine patch superfamily enzyme